MSYSDGYNFNKHRNYTQCHNFNPDGNDPTPVWDFTSNEIGEGYECEECGCTEWQFPAQSATSSACEGAFCLDCGVEARVIDVMLPIHAWKNYNARSQPSRYLHTVYYAEKQLQFRCADPDIPRDVVCTFKQYVIKRRWKREWKKTWKTLKFPVSCLPQTHAEITPEFQKIAEENFRRHKTFSKKDINRILTRAKIPKRKYFEKWRKFKYMLQNECALIIPGEVRQQMKSMYGPWAQAFLNIRPDIVKILGKPRKSMTHTNYNSQCMLIYLDFHGNLTLRETYKGILPLRSEAKNEEYEIIRMMMANNMHMDFIPHPDYPIDQDDPRIALLKKHGHYPRFQRP